jgi:hypothetical protein
MKNTIGKLDTELPKRPVTPGSMRPVIEGKKPASGRPPENRTGKVGGISSLTKVAVASALIGIAGGTTYFAAHPKKTDEPSHAQTVSAKTQPAPAGTQGVPRKTQALPVEPIPAEFSREIANSSDVGKPKTPQELARFLDENKLHPTAADFDKPLMVSVKGKSKPVPVREWNGYFDALRLVVKKTAPSQGDDPNEKDGGSYEKPGWEKLSYNNNNFFSERDTLIAIRVKKPQYMDEIEFFGIHMPIELHDKKRGVIYALLDSCKTVNNKLTEHSQIASFTLREGGRNLRICPYWVPACKNTVSAPVESAPVESAPDAGWQP